LGYLQYRCFKCYCQFNKRTGTRFNHISHRTEVVFLVVIHYLRYMLSLDDVVVLMTTRGNFISHQTVHNWVLIFGAECGKLLRTFRRNKNRSKKWHVDHCTLKIKGEYYYFYRCFDKNGDLIDVILSDSKDQDVAEQFFDQCTDTAGYEPSMIATDKEPAQAIGRAKVFQNRVEHRVSKYKNNRLESRHRQPRSRIRPMKNFKDPISTLIFLHSYEELDQLFRCRCINRSKKHWFTVSRFSDFRSLVI